MANRTQEAIFTSFAIVKKICDIMFMNEEHEYIDSYYIDDVQNEWSNTECANSKSVYYLSKSIESLSQANVLVTISYPDMYRGCSTEIHIFQDYELGEIIKLPIQYICPDLVQKEDTTMKLELK